MLHSSVPNTQSSQPAMQQTSASVGRVSTGRTNRGLSGQQVKEINAAIESFPLWMKQVIYIQLKSELDKHMSTRSLDSLNRSNFLQLWTPSLTTEGIKALLNEETSITQTLLHSIKSKEAVYSICAEKNMSLEQFSIQVLDCLQNHWVQEPASPQIRSTIEYLAGKTKIGDYLVSLNKINKNDLADALKTQRYISSTTQEQIGIGEILVRLNLVSQEDIENILFLKQQATQTLSL